VVNKWLDWRVSTGKNDQSSSDYTGKSRTELLLFYHIGLQINLTEWWLFAIITLIVIHLLIESEQYIFKFDIQIPINMLGCYMTALINGGIKNE